MTLYLHNYIHSTHTRDLAHILHASYLTSAYKSHVHVSHTYRMYGNIVLPVLRNPRVLLRQTLLQADAFILTRLQREPHFRCQCGALPLQLLCLLEGMPPYLRFHLGESQEYCCAPKKKVNPRNIAVHNPMPSQQTDTKIVRTIFVYKDSTYGQDGRGKKSVSGGGGETFEGSMQEGPFRQACKYLYLLLSLLLVCC
jgi:hypothetical protein